MKLLFVCTGNTCRSSMAEAIAKNLSIKEKDESIFGSAGIMAIPELPASDNAIKVMKEKQIDLSGHKARQLTVELLKEADLVLTMTKAHKSRIINYFPEFDDKVFTMKEYISQEDIDIRDPFGQTIEVYKKTALEIEEEIKKLLVKIKKN